MVLGEGGTGERAISAQEALGERLAAFKRFYRWLNLTLVHQALWPLLVLLADAPGEAPEATPMPWFLARIGATALAATLALIYLSQRPLGVVPASQEEARDGEGMGMVLTQLRLVAIGLPLMLAGARLLGDQSDWAVKLLLFGLVDVVAYHLIHFGVVVRSYPRLDQGKAAAVILFGLSSAIRAALLTGIGGEGGSMGLAFGGGLTLGLLLGAAVLAVREVLGGFWPAAALHWFVIYLIFGFTD